ncbi:MAG: PLP-dependent aminotransferase family protein [Oscillospiraceae bacterium]|nr:PLP-dependent aminotransferase family protein [Oscillospiraceae bacterium]
MNFKFSERISTLQPSAIREILKVTQDPTVISFAAGNPAPESFPAAEMAEIAAEIFANDAASALQYGVSEGYNPLRTLTAKRMKEKYNVGRTFDDTLITSGGQQVIEMLTKVLVNEGDVILCEMPSFIGALNAFRSYNAKLIGIPMDDDGMDLEVLERTLQTTKNVKFIYTIPTFQNPSGHVMSLARRKKLLELAETYNVLILEDSPYFELRFAGEYVPPIKSLDETGRVIFSGSYSKVLSPGMRIGFCIAHKDLVAKLTVAKQVSDVHTNLFFQMIAARFLERHDLDAHIAKICTLYGSRAQLMCDLIDEKFDGKVRYVRPTGGLFLWCSLPDGYDAMDFCRKTGEKKVVAVPGSSFSVDEHEVTPTFRMNYSLPSEDQIRTGIDLMADVLKDYVK